MKTLILFALSLFSSALMARANEWFIPPTGEGDAKNVEVINNEGKVVGDITYVYKNGKIDNIVFSKEFDKEFKDLIKSSMLEALESNERAMAMAENLDTLFFTKGIDISAEDGKGSYTIKFDGTLKDALNKDKGTANLKAKTTADIADRNSLTWTGGDDGTKLEIAGFSKADPTDSLMNNLGNESLAIPAKSGKSITWLTPGNISGFKPDDKSISTNNLTGSAHIYHFYYAQSLARNKGLAFPVNDGKDHLQWYTPEDFIGKTLLWEDDAINVNYGMSLIEDEYGFIDVNIGDTLEIGEEDGYVNVLYEAPIVLGENGLTVNIGSGLGIEETEDGGGKIVVNHDGTLAEVDESGMIGVNADGVSIQCGEDPSYGMAVGIYGWDWFYSWGEDLSTMLTSEESADRDYIELLARYGGPGGSLEYVALGDTISPDDETLEFDTQHKLSIKPGEDGKFIRTIGDNVTWDYAVSGIYLNNVEKELDENSFVNLGNLASAAVVNNKTIKVGDDGTVNLGSVVTAVAINGNTVSPNGDGLVDLGVVSSGGGGAPGDNQSIQLNVNSAGVTNYSIKGWSEETTCNENMYDLLTDKQNSDRNTHEILCRVGGAGGNMHFAPLGEAIPTPDSSQFEIGQTDGKFKIKAGTSGKFLKTDGADVTWGSAVASIESSDTSQLEVSAPDSSGKVTLTPKNLGGGVTVIGTSGSESGGKIRFESMTDSNVKIEVSKNGDGDIVVKIGVYYK